MTADPASQARSGDPVLPTRPLLCGLYHVVVLGPDRLAVSNAGRNIVLSGPRCGELGAPFLAALDGLSTLDELRLRFPELRAEAVDGLVSSLAAKGLVGEGPGRPDNASAAPQRAAAALAPGAAAAGIAAVLSRSVVTILGCGPVGCTSAVLLAKAGVGHLVLVDPDPMTSAAVGMSCVLSPAGGNETGAQAAWRALARAETATTVSIVDGPEDAVGWSDLAVVELGCGLAGAGIVGTWADACLVAGIPYLVYGQDGLQTVVGPLVGSGGAPCHHCLETRALSHIDHFEQHLAYRRHRDTHAPRADVFLAAHASTVAGLVATHALRGLLDDETELADGSLVLDLATSAMHREEVLAVPGCPDCAAVARDEASEPVTAPREVRPSLGSRRPPVAGQQRKNH